MMKNKPASNRVFKFISFALLILHPICSSAQQAFTTNKTALNVIGQPDFNSGSINQGGSVEGNTLNTPGQTLILNSKFIIADALNNRVLIYNSIPTQNNLSADVVIGQYDFVHNLEDHGGTTSSDALDRPSGLATDGKKLFILDRDNHRVLIYNSLPTVNGAAADIVIGHEDMTDGSWGGESGLNDTLGLSAYKLSSGPTGLIYDSVTGKLIFYDSDNDRILIYNHIPDSNGAAADVVIGQPDFTHNKTNQGSFVGSNTLNLSTCSGLAIFHGKLLIADRENNRVLIYNKIPTNNNAMADVVIGQADFTHNYPNQGGPISASGMDRPRAIAVDKFGRLYIAEAGNERILVYNKIPVRNGVAADDVIGKSDFITSGETHPSDSTFYWIYHLLINDDKLIVSDAENNRILFFKIDAFHGKENSDITSSVITLYSNPNRGIFNLKFNKIPVGSFNIVIFDMAGRAVYRKYLDSADGDIKLTLPNLNSGRYTIRITGDGINATLFMEVLK